VGHFLGTIPTKRTTEQKYMTTDFDIEDNYALRQNGSLFDLHNNFDLSDFFYNVKTREFIITWTKAFGEWVKSDEADELTVRHKNVSFLSISDRDVDSTTEDDKCLSEISFFPSTSRDINDSIVIQKRPTENDDILYFFESGQLIRICCDTIELKYTRK
jgi:hypothetical protein